MDETIVLETTADVEKGIADDLQADLQEATGLPVIRGDEVTLLAEDRDPRNPRYKSSLILYHLPEVPPGRLLLLLTGADIFSGSLNFVYGHADPANRKAMVSTFRLANDPVAGPATPEELRRRLFTEALREVGLMRGLEDCDEPTCAMCFAFTLYDNERKLPAYCERCSGLLS
jgi:predicted Zn-dependent protease